jgi:hypothetical protein
MRTIFSFFALSLLVHGCFFGGDSSAPDPICEPFKRMCVNMDVMACNEAGTAWSKVQTCNAECVDGFCDGACVPDCVGKECGDDGCGGSCGGCPASKPACSDFACVEGCAPYCTGKECGDDGCGGNCGYCKAGESCMGAGVCSADCTPNCGGKTCGSDGCGGSCGTCPQGKKCDQSKGLCEDDCPGSNCGEYLDCEEFFMCAAECGDWDDACKDQCLNNVDPSEAVLVGALAGCITNNWCGQCADESCYDACLSDNCMNELLSCFSNECWDHYDCGYEDICLMGLCFNAYGRDYLLTFHSAEIWEDNPSTGSSWDAIGGMPDPFIKYQIGDVTGTTVVEDDTLTPYWLESVEVTLAKSQEISIKVMDEDLSNHDTIGDVDVPGNKIPIDWLKDEGVELTPWDQGFESLILVIEPL